MPVAVARVCVYWCALVRTTGNSVWRCKSVLINTDYKSTKAVQWLSDSVRCRGSAGLTLSLALTVNNMGNFLGCGCCGDEAKDQTDGKKGE